MNPPMLTCSFCKGPMRRTRKNSERCRTRDAHGELIEIVKVEIYCPTCLERHLAHGFPESTFHPSWVSFRTDGKPGDLYLKQQAEMRNPTREFIMPGSLDGVE